MQTGDILLIHTKWCPISWLIRKLTKSNWNHCALVFYDKLLDFRGHKLEYNNFSKYKNKFWYRIKLIRLQELTDKQKENLTYSALVVSYLEKQGYLRFLLTLFLLIINYKGKLPRNICSGCIVKIFELTGIHIYWKKYSRITPEDLNKIGKEIYD